MAWEFRIARVVLMRKDVKVAEIQPSKAQGLLLVVVLAAVLRL